MKIINGKKFYEREIKAAVEIGSSHRTGWSNTQYYTVLYNPACGLTILDAHNTGDCYGDYSTNYFASPAAFREWCGRYHDDPNKWGEYLGDIDETNAAAMDFVDKILGA